jgi:formylglycine-generating enzyme required for sulfatase activity
MSNPVEHLLSQLADPHTPPKRRADIGMALAVLGDDRLGVGVDPAGLPHIEWCFITGRLVTLVDHQTQRLGDFQVQSFYIAQYPVTVAQFRAFIKAADGYSDDRWWRGLAFGKQIWPDNQESANLPATQIPWVNAIAFSQWLAAKMMAQPDLLPNLPGNSSVGTIRLPTEAEWWLAATNGDPARLYPWGERWDATYANAKESKLDSPVAIGLYPFSAAPCGALDMVGNTWEWCLNEFAQPNQIELQGSERRALRGGSYLDSASAVRCTSRLSQFPISRSPASSFRLAYTSHSALPY